MPRAFRWSVVLCLLPQVFLAAHEGPTRPPLTPQVIEDALRTDWYGVYFQDKKIGYMKSAASRLEAPAAGFRVAVHQKIGIVSEGATLDMTTDQVMDFDAQLPYRLRKIVLVETQGKARQETTLTRTSKGFTVSTVNKADKQTKQVPAIDFTFTDVLGSYAWLRSRPAVGAVFRGQDLDVDELKLEPETRKLLARRTALVKGVHVTYYEVEANQPRHGLTTLERYDDKGNLLSGRIAEQFEVRLEAEELAKDFKAGADVFVLGMVKIDRPLGNGRKVTEMVAEVTGKDVTGLTAGPMQDVVRNPSGSFTLKVGKAHGKPLPATPQELADNLLATGSYPAAHPRVLALARQAVGNARTDRDKVERLVHFVHHYIEPSYGNKGLLVLDLLDKKAGDCTAYAALFTTLARAAGVPTRELSGFLYVGDAQKAFGGHAWNEAAIDGFWVPVDASCGQTQVDATHISLGADTRGGVNLLRNFGNLSLRLIAVHHKD